MFPFFCPSRKVFILIFFFFASVEYFSLKWNGNVKMHLFSSQTATLWTFPQRHCGCVSASLFTLCQIDVVLLLQSEIVSSLFAPTTTKKSFAPKPFAGCYSWMYTWVCKSVVSHVREQQKLHNTHHLNFNFH